MIDTLNVYGKDSLSAIAVRVIAFEDNSSFCSLTLNEILTLVLTIVGVWVAICQFRNEMRKNRNETLMPSMNKKRNVREIGC